MCASFIIADMFRPSRNRFVAPLRFVPTGARGLGAATLLLVLLMAQLVRGDELLLGPTARSSRGMVVTVSEPATRVGLEVLAQGGNSVDASVAVAFALAVTWPEAGNIGGGGFMLIKPPASPPVLVDYREVAPSAARPDTFVSATSALNHLAVGVPGTVRGLAAAHQKFGKLPWKSLVTPAVRLAREGFPASQALADSLNGVLGRSNGFEEFERVYAVPHGGRWKAGDILRQPDLARTLETIADDGPDGFYSGRIADLIVAEMQAAGGLIGRDDLKDYSARIREPLVGRFRDVEVLTTPAPAGGVVLVEMLHILENFDLKQSGQFSPETMHIVAEAARRAFADRARYLGDPQFTTLPPELSTPEYGRRLAATIDGQKATPSESVALDIPLADESPETTHFSIIDAQGLAVANTYTLEQSFGSRVVVRGAGFLLNNEMGDFNWKPGVTNRRGQIGTDPNLVAPGKRMASSQTPTIVLRDGKVLLVTGSPGGRTIPNTVLQVILNRIEFGNLLADAVSAPRYHHQWFPDEIALEPTLDKLHPALANTLRTRGHRVRVRSGSQGDANSIEVNLESGERIGVADQRRHGWAGGQ